jgi:hypothetical protein
MIITQSVHTGINMTTRFVQANIHDGTDVLYCNGRTSLEQMIRKSTFSDLVVFSVSSASLEPTGNESYSLTGLLVGCKCPLLIVPPGCYNVNEVILVFDGSVSSFITIIQFCLLFAKLLGGNITLLHTESSPDRACYAHLLCWLDRHCSPIKEKWITGSVKSGLSSLIEDSSNSLIVFGKPYQNTVSHFYRTHGCSACTSAVYIRSY